MIVFLSLTFQCIFNCAFYIHSQCNLVLKIVLERRQLLGNLGNILILYNFLMTTTNQILAKLLYLWLTFFQFHLWYESQ